MIRNNIATSTGTYVSRVYHLWWSSAIANMWINRSLGKRDTYHRLQWIRVYSVCNQLDSSGTSLRVPSKSVQLSHLNALQRHRIRCMCARCARLNGQCHFAHSRLSPAKPQMSTHFIYVCNRRFYMPYLGCTRFSVCTWCALNYPVIYALPSRTSAKFIYDRLCFAVLADAGRRWRKRRSLTTNKRREIDYDAPSRWISSATIISPNATVVPFQCQWEWIK